jgi:hypothetical protein
MYTKKPDRDNLIGFVNEHASVEEPGETHTVGPGVEGGK